MARGHKLWSSELYFPAAENFNDTARSSRGHPGGRRGGAVMRTATHWRRFRKRRWWTLRLASIRAEFFCFSKHHLGTTLCRSGSRLKRTNIVGFETAGWPQSPPYTIRPQNWDGGGQMCRWSEREILLPRILLFFFFFRRKVWSFQRLSDAGGWRL